MKLDIYLYRFKKSLLSPLDKGEEIFATAPLYGPAKPVPSVKNISYASNIPGENVLSPILYMYTYVRMWVSEKLSPGKNIYSSFAMKGAKIIMLSDILCGLGVLRGSQFGAILKVPPTPFTKGVGFWLSDAPKCALTLAAPS